MLRQHQARHVALLGSLQAHDLERQGQGPFISLLQADSINTSCTRTPFNCREGVWLDRTAQQYYSTEVLLSCLGRFLAHPCACLEDQGDRVHALLVLPW